MSGDDEGSEAMRVDVQHAAAVAAILWPEFTVVGDLVFFAWAAPTSLFVGPGDRTNCESTANHTHVLDLFAHRAGLAEEPFQDDAHPDFAAACRFGERWAHAVATKLWCEFPSRHFLVYYTALDQPIVRFHQLHPGEPPWLDPADWEDAIARGELVVHEVRGRDPAYVPGAWPRRGCAPPKGV